MNYIDALAQAIHDAAPHDGPIEADEWPLYRLYAVLGLVKGQDVTLEDVHDAWAAWRSEAMPEHRSIRPFSELDRPVQLLDQPYVDAIKRAMAERRAA